MKVSVRTVKKDSRKVEISLRRVPAAKVVNVRPVRIADQTEPILPAQTDDLTDEDAGQQEPPSSEPVIAQSVPEEASPIDDLLEEVDTAIDLADEQFAEIEAIIAESNDESAVTNEADELEQLIAAEEIKLEVVGEDPPAITAEELEIKELEELIAAEEREQAAILEGTAADNTADASAEVIPEAEPDADIPSAPLFEVAEDDSVPALFQPAENTPVHPVTEDSESDLFADQLPFADNTLYDYQSVDVDGDGVPEKGIFRRFFDRGRIKSDEDNADGVEYMCVDDNSGKMSRLCGIIKKHKPNEE